MSFRILRNRRIFVVASFALLASLLFVSSAWAIETRGGENVTIGADEVVEDDLYVAAQTVTVEGTVQGDLVAAGGTVRVNGGTVEGDLISAGQTVIVNGTVEDDVRIAGQALLVGEDAQIEDDLIAAALSLETEPGSTVGGELLYGGYQALGAGGGGGAATAGSGRGASATAAG